MRVCCHAMNLIDFLTQRRPEWRTLEALVEQVQGSGLGSLSDEQAVAFGRLYRRAASDLNQAQTFVSSDATVQYLNGLVARCYAAIHGRRRLHFWRAVGSYVTGYPAVVRRYFGHFLLAAAILLGTGVLGFLACLYDVLP